MEVAGFTKTFAIDQGAVLGNDQLFASLYNQPLTDSKREGICTGLSMIWLARLYMFHNETPAERLSALSANSGYRWGGKTQDIHIAAGVGGGGSFDEQIAQRYTDALKAYSLRIVGGSLVSTNAADAATKAKDLAAATRQKHAYRLWLLVLQTTTGVAGHMVASYASGGKMGFARHLYFFDPNMGEYKVPVGDTEKFLTAFVKSYEADFSGVPIALNFAVQR